MVLLRLRSIAGCGNCKIEFGSYHGDGSAVTGAYGSEQNVNTLTFSGQPLLIIISCEGLNDKLIMHRKAPCGYVMSVDSSVVGTVKADWSVPNSVKWHSNSGLFATSKFTVWGIR